MAEDDKPRLGDVVMSGALGEKPALFPDAYFPLIYFDTVVSMSVNRETVKFYPARINPNILGTGGDQQLPIGQVVMPRTGFVLTALFFLDQLRSMKDDPGFEPFRERLREKCAAIVEEIDGRRA